DPTASAGDSLPLTVAGCIDRACDHYEAEWKTGRRPQIEAYLAEAAEHDSPALLRELLLLELEFRTANGEQPTLDEYRARFPGHDTVIDSVFQGSERDSGATAPIHGSTVGTATSAGARFRILHLHDRGGLGNVYLARDLELNRDVALKEIQDRFADHPVYRARFQFEAEITGGLEHPGIVPVYGLGHHADGRPYYAMRFIKGDS